MRRLLDFLLSNSTWKDGDLHATLQQPFDIISESTDAAARLKGEGRQDSVKAEIWLAF